MTSIKDGLGLEPTGRPTKSTTSISDKLARESLRLSQMQDIAGCRIVVPDILVQDAVVPRLTAMFQVRSVFDRRESPSSGYRAVHVIVRHQDQPIEIQVRTALQHMWAELSEKLSDVVAPSIKYGGGPKELTDILLSTSRTGASVEDTERRIEALRARGRSDEALQAARHLMDAKNYLAELLRDMIRDAHIWKDD